MLLSVIPVENDAASISACTSTDNFTQNSPVEAVEAESSLTLFATAVHWSDLYGDWNIQSVICVEACNPDV